MSAIGTAESIHAANRGENIVMIFVNNAIYGMTGGQMAPTTLVGQKTATTPYGRRIDLNGHPLEITNLMAIPDGTCYVTRQAVHTPAAVRKTKSLSQKAFENAIAKKAPLLWKLSPPAIPDGRCRPRKRTNGWKRTCSPNIRSETLRMCDTETAMSGNC